MVEHVKAWQCIGCGKIEAPQTCVGICQDRRVEFVYAAEYEEALAELERERQRAKTLATLVRQLASTTPNAGGWEGSYRAMQNQARRMLAALAENDHDAVKSGDGNQSGAGAAPLAST
ncbi:MAG: hypothetical protein M0P95_11605 [Sulfuritalea sp.]|jgi:hypothetical protein|nr:hypothetical protein [Sulfuritalea sp.]